MSRRVDEERRRESEAQRVARARQRLEEMHRILALWRGRESNMEVARALGISESTLLRRMRALGLTREATEATRRSEGGDVHGC